MSILRNPCSDETFFSFFFKNKRPGWILDPFFHMLRVTTWLIVPWHHQMNFINSCGFFLCVSLFCTETQVGKTPQFCFFCFLRTHVSQNDCKATPEVRVVDGSLHEKENVQWKRVTGNSQKTRSWHSRKFDGVKNRSWSEWSKGVLQRHRASCIYLGWKELSVASWVRSHDSSNCFLSKMYVCSRGDWRCYVGTGAKWYWSRPWFALEGTFGWPPPPAINQVRTKVKPPKGYATPRDVPTPTEVPPSHWSTTPTDVPPSDWCATLPLMW